MAQLIFSNIVLSLVILALLLKNRHGIFRSLLILVLLSNIGSILRNSLFLEQDSFAEFMVRLNVWLNIGIGYFTILLVYDIYHKDFAFLRGKKVAYVRAISIIYGLALLYFLTQDNFIISMIGYGLPVVLLFALAFFTKPIRTPLVAAGAIIIAASLYLTFGPLGGAALFKRSDIYHYGLAVGFVIFHKAIQ